MYDILANLDPLFRDSFLGLIIHFVTKYTQDKHGNTRPFVIIVCVLLGFIVALSYLVFGQETVLESFCQFFKTAGVALSVASTIWVFSKPVRELKPTMEVKRVVKKKTKR